MLQWKIAIPVVSGISVSETIPADSSLSPPTMPNRFSPAVCPSKAQPGSPSFDLKGRTMIYAAITALCLGSIFGLVPIPLPWLLVAMVIYFAVSTFTDRV